MCEQITFLEWIKEIIRSKFQRQGSNLKYKKLCNHRQKWKLRQLLYFICKSGSRSLQLGHWKSIQFNSRNCSGDHQFRTQNNMWLNNSILHEFILSWQCQHFYLMFKFRNCWLLFEILQIVCHELSLT